MGSEQSAQLEEIAFNHVTPTVFADGIIGAMSDCEDSDEELLNDDYDSVNG